MTPAEAIDTLRGHSRAQICTLTPKECGELAKALEFDTWTAKAVAAEREECVRVARTYADACLKSSTMDAVAVRAVVAGVERIIDAMRARGGK